nr:SKP1-like protein 21 isoform X1 [Malus domestica]
MPSSKKSKTMIVQLMNSCHSLMEKLEASLEVRKLCVTDSKGIKTSKNKKKNRRRKDQQKSTCLYEANELHEVSSNLNFACPSDQLNKFTPSSSLTLKLQDLKDDRVDDMIGFDDGDIDDEIDPALKEKIDREVEDFARRLNSDWPERMQEILSLGQERRPVPFSINGNSSFRRYACMISFFLLFCFLPKASTIVFFLIHNLLSHK